MKKNQNEYRQEQLEIMIMKVCGTMRKLTDEEKYKYLKFPHQCPYCGTDAIAAKDIDSDEGNTLIQNIGCDDCGAEWQDYYKLIEIIELD